MKFVKSIALVVLGIIAGVAFVVSCSSGVSPWDINAGSDAVADTGNVASVTCKQWITFKFVQGSDEDHTTYCFWRDDKGWRRQASNWEGDIDIACDPDSKAISLPEGWEPFSAGSLNPPSIVARKCTAWE